MSNKRPIILEEGNYTLRDLNALMRSYKIFEVHDIFENQIEELFQINNPHLMLSSSFETKKQEYLKKRRGRLSGNWVYFPWSGRLVHMVGKCELNTLRTNRNRELISIKEQKMLLGFVAGVCGLSVGGSIALALSYLGISETIKLSDFDIVSTSNLNRVMLGVSDIGISKTAAISRRIYEINPYAGIILFDKGLDKKNLKDFFTGKPKLNLVFDEIDDIEMKIHLRLFARKINIPVVMMTNIGDRVLVDIERYDLNPDLQLFNGKLGEIPNRILREGVSDSDIKKYSVEIVGRSNLPEKALKSVGEIGKTLVGRPQIMSSVSATGGIAAYIARRVALNDHLLSGRYLFKFGDIFQNLL